MLSQSQKIDILRRELSVSGGWRAVTRDSRELKIWTELNLNNICTAFTNQELALVVTWLRCSERRQKSKTTMEDKSSLLYVDTRSCMIHLRTFIETGIKRILLGRKWVRRSDNLVSCKSSSLLNLSYIQCPPLILALLINMSKGGCENKSALFILLIFHSINSQNSNHHWSKTIESGEKISWWNKCFSPMNVGHNYWHP